MTKLQRNLCIATIALAVLTLGYCKAHGETQILIRFVPREMIQVKAAECKGECASYPAEAVTTGSEFPNRAEIWLPENEPFSLPLLQHEICHTQIGPDGKFKTHTADGTWKHTGRKDRC